MESNWLMLLFAVLAGAAEPPGGTGAEAPAIVAEAPGEFRPLRLAVPGRIYDAGPSDLRDVAVSAEPYPALTLRLAPDFGDWLAATTAAHLGEPMRMSVCGREVSAPVIREPILGGSLQLSGDFDLGELTVISEVLAGARDCAAFPGAGGPDDAK